jgi:hypothetical protein
MGIELESKLYMGIWGCGCTEHTPWGMTNQVDIYMLASI